MTHLLEFPKAIKDIASRDSYIAALMQEYDRKAIGLMDLIELTIKYLDCKSRTISETLEILDGLPSRTQGLIRPDSVYIATEVIEAAKSSLEPEPFLNQFELKPEITDEILP